eukprot:scaffold488_cov109-Skeletonema_dohrnii-CCMP3373.AAC.7
MWTRTAIKSSLGQIKNVEELASGCMSVKVVMTNRYLLTHQTCCSKPQQYAAALERDATSIVE